MVEWGVKRGLHDMTNRTFRALCHAALALSQGHCFASRARLVVTGNIFHLAPPCPLWIRRFSFIRLSAQCRKGPYVALRRWLVGQGLEVKTRVCPMSVQSLSSICPSTDSVQESGGGGRYIFKMTLSHIRLEGIMFYFLSMSAASLLGPSLEQSEVSMYDV